MKSAHERRSEEMRLQIEQEIADLMEKQGATMSGTDKTDSIAIRAGECTLHKTEEFRANQRCRNCSAIQSVLPQSFPRALIS
jgi:hypothetical protein